jgi:tetratricopeptide (TPR) repeat protein
MSRFANLEFEPENRLKKANQEEPVDDRRYFRLGEELHRQARFEEALRSYSRSLEYNPNLVEAWVGQVRMLIELGEHKEARMWADKALEVHRDHADLLSAKAVAFAREGERQKALEFSDAALIQKGNSAYVWMARGEVLMGGDGRGSEHCFEKAQAASHRDWFVHLGIGRILHYWGKLTLAILWVQRATEADPAQPFAWQVLGDCQAALDLPGQAEMSYIRALELDRANAAAQHGLTRLRNRGAYSRIREWFRSLFRG